MTTEDLDYRKMVSGKSVAIVGPAMYMMNSGHGDEIDSHDIVVRINRGLESTLLYPSDIGKRTDIYYSCLIERAQQTGKLDPDTIINTYGINHIVAPPHSDIKGISNSMRFHDLVDENTLRNLHMSGISIYMIDNIFHTDLAIKVNCKPNTGFLAIYDLLSTDLKSLSIYGFSFYLDGFLPGQKSGVENEKNCTEQEFANMAFNSKRHVQKNMWNYAKETLLKNPIVNLDPVLEVILNLKFLDRNLFNNIFK
jgi:hypothetical protein